MSYLFAAYTVIWTLLFVFLLFIHKRQQEVQARLESLTRSREENLPGGASASRPGGFKRS